MFLARPEILISKAALELLKKRADQEGKPYKSFAGECLLIGLMQKCKITKTDSINL